MDSYSVIMYLFTLEVRAGLFDDFPIWDRSIWHMGYKELRGYQYLLDTVILMHPYTRVCIRSPNQTIIIYASFLSALGLEISEVLL